MKKNFGFIIFSYFIIHSFKTSILSTLVLVNQWKVKMIILTSIENYIFYANDKRLWLEKGWFPVQSQSASFKDEWYRVRLWEFSLAVTASSSPVNLLFRGRAYSACDRSHPT